MNWIKVLAIGIQIFIGFAVAFFYVRILKRRFLGMLWGATVVGIIGSVLGGFFLNDIFAWMVNNITTVNYVATISGALFLIWGFSKMTHDGRD
ncbi:hypothetical protein BREVNS_0980 [Brevinematales bacterium NS]|jgi:uncharacterized membrane protein YeaQ/YmgE (transglycosylase-associated protein family)|nr:hypothetical protein BREVNS_0980 [Brevinematales bacterium NS]